MKKAGAHHIFQDLGWCENVRGSCYNSVDGCWLARGGLLVVKGVNQPPAANCIAASSGSSRSTSTVKRG